jgi:ankyrin repeat protein
MDMNDEELVFAADRGNLQAVRELLAEGADPNSDDGDWNALTASSMRGHIRVVQELLKAGADPNAAVRGNTALLSAAGEGRLPVVQILLAAGADPNAFEEEFEGETILYAAAYSNGPDYLEVVQALLAAGADPNIRGGEGEIALYGGGRLPVVRALLAAGANPNIPGAYGVTALLEAAMDGEVPVIRELLAWGADPTLADDDDRTPLDYPEVQQAWQERLAAQRGLDEYSTRHNLPPGFSEQVFRILYPR